MKKRKMHIAICMLASVILSHAGGQHTEGGLQIIRCDINHTQNGLDVTFTADLDSLQVGMEDEWEIQPLIVTSADTFALPPLVVAGKIRDKVNRRKALLEGDSYIPAEYYRVIPQDLDDVSVITYRQKAPFQDWMYGGRVVLRQAVSGCHACKRSMADVPLCYIPRPPKVSFMVPKPEFKEREEEIIMHLNFLSGRSDVLAEYKNNKEELAQIHTAIEKILNDSTLRLEAIQLCGFASPEGDYDYNTRLSSDRTQAVKEYILKRYPIAPQMIDAGSESEDWEGLRELIAVSELPAKQQILAIITETSDPDHRDVLIRQIDGGATYRKLLDDFYPPLRRVVCETRYTIAPFTADQGKRILVTYPDRLSLNEWYLIAESYPPGSDDFKKTFSLALQYYPQDVVANNNMAAVALGEGDLAMAHKCLDSRQGEINVQNNIGVLYWKEGRPDEALRCFEKAAAQGCEEAEYNLKELQAARSVP